MKIKAAMFVIMFLSLPLAAAAQTSRGTVSGVVTDPNGAVIAGSTVTLTNTQTNVANTTITNDEGFYRFDAVILGNYTVDIEAPGFGRATRTGVVVNANQTSAVDVQLAPGGQNVVVEVTADAGAQLQTEAPVRGGNISTRQIVNLPVASRNPVSLALTLPGVSTNRFGFGIGTFSVNGARGRSNNFLLDGVENNDISVAGQGFQITNPDAVQEVSVQTSNYDAEFGRSGGAVINTITKAGTNEFNGTLSAFLDSTRDDAITSSLSRQPAIQQRRRLLPGTQQIYSGTIGGPVFLPRFGEGGPAVYNGRERTFFFASFQEERQNSAGSVQLTTPSAAGRARLRQLFAPGVNRNVDTLLAVTQGAVANTNFLDLDLGQGRGPIQFGTALRTYANTLRDRQIQARIDHKLGENDQLTGRYVFGDQLDPEGGQVRFAGFEAAFNNRISNFLLNYVRTFSPSFTNDLRLAYSRIEYGFPVIGDDPLINTLPQISITNVSFLGLESTLPQGRLANNYVIQDTATYIYNNHTFRFGFDLLEQRSRQSAPFRGRGTLSYGNSSAGGQTFSGLANFVDDFGGSGSAQRDFGSPVYYPELFRQAYFFQDRWRVNGALTLTLGLRYENFGNPINSLGTAAFTGLFNVDPRTFTGPYSQPNEVADDNNNFAPTVGIAYSPAFTDGIFGTVFGEKRTVIRAGYQIGYDSFFNNIASNAASSSPNVIATSTASTPDAANPRGFANLSSSFPLVPRPLSPLDGQTLVDPKLRNPYFQRFSVGIQRELPSNVVVDVAYVGSKGTKLYYNEDRNPTVPPALRITPAGFTGSTTCTPSTAGCSISGRLDNLQGPRLTRTNGGSSSYHSGQLSVTRRFARGLAATASYTYSKLIDNGSEVFGTAGNNAPQNPARPAILFSERLDRAVSLFDRPHRASFTYVYPLPFFEGQQGFLGRLLGGFELSGVTVFESGAPLNVYNGVDTDGIGGNFDRPDFNPAGRFGVRAIPATATSPSATGYVNPDVIVGRTSSGANILAPLDPREAQFIGLPSGSPRTGNLGRNALRTPGTNNFDLNILKRTRLSEGTSIEFRAEFFNVFNHPQYAQGSISPFTPAGGNIQADVFATPAGEFLLENNRLSDGGGRVIRYQVKFIF